MLYQTSFMPNIITKSKAINLIINQQRRMKIGKLKQIDLKSF